MPPRELIDLGQPSGSLLEPAGKPIVQIRPKCLRQRGICGVADQYVAKAKRIVAL